ncbi:hypothetical protein JKF63_01502 [Porcisia hertigi]|uniref:VLRF1 domain-containing protein n=1 Tax=Porcisia hertigi TaxID=2761500 RepID=A0A836L0P9_9TRYP|nr:hypothetical protein JKF63_01502 [Porcisia hertigi]
MLLGDVETKITAVLKSLHDAPRTIYEAENLYQLNRERIAAIYAALADLSGDYVDQLRVRCGEAEKAVQAKRATGVAGTTAVDNAFSLDFAIEEAQAQNEAEIQSAMAAAASGSRRPKKSNAKEKPTKKKNGEEGHKKRSKQTMDHELSAPPHPLRRSSSSSEEDVAAKATSSVLTRWEVISRVDSLISREVPSALLTSGRGTCEAVPNTPLARAYFTSEMEWEGTPCHCAVELYRCVMIAMAYGEPQLSWTECENRVLSQSAPEPELNTMEKGCFSPHTSKNDRMGSPKASSDSDDEGSQGNSALGDEDMTLSEQLVAEYDLAQQAEEEKDTDTSTLPQVVSARFQERLRSFSDEVWVILLCHGGYFSGGVFVKGTCVAHKTFQRYVVRKKQGGKQSSNAKDVGSYNSVGSQIRAAQEVKWRIDVRNILLDWIPYIQASSFILYAAPGPQNRAALTDFSLPAAASVGGNKSISPVQLKDPRVSRVPLTTHRPTFEEVKRIYSVCSLCSVLYVREAAL